MLVAPSSLLSPFFSRANRVSRLPPLLIAVATVAIGGCGTAPRQESRIERPPAQAARAPAPATTPTPAPRILRGGAYYLDDGPGDSPPADLDSIPEPVPQLEPLHRGAMRPYVVLGQQFTPMTELQPYKARGVATWYGRRYHGKQTSNGEIYDMYEISAAHPTLPLPSYARVTNLSSGKSVIVRINDRGPFLDNRLIDLSYTAAHRIGVVGAGSALVEVESIIPDGPSAPVSTAARMPSRSRIAVAKAGSGAAPAPSKAAAASATGAEEDPILAIAAAARDVDPLSTARERSSTMPTGSKETTADNGGVYLQLGAFGSRENAESYLARAKVQFDWLAERLQVRPREGLYRVHAGPYATLADARQAAERIALALGVKPVLTR